MHTISVYHNQTSRFFPYEPGHELTPTVSYRRTIADINAAVELAWTLFNIDLDQLETGRTSADGEADFLIACLYRLLGHRSLSVGDVVAVRTEQETSWWACEPVGWRPIDPPLVAVGEPLTAEAIYTALRERWTRP